jgi:leader peptidase (prepilin peptidase)/N-methyltransferase
LNTILRYLDTYSYYYIIPIVLLYIIVASITDIKEKKIFDKLNYSFLLLRIIAIPIYPIQRTHIVGFIAAFFIVLIPAMIKGRQMGGDIKFAAVLGAWIGDDSIFASILIACVFFVLFAFVGKKKKDDMIPFGPFISIGTIFTVIHYAVLSI